MASCVCMVQKFVSETISSSTISRRYDEQLSLVIHVGGWNPFLTIAYHNIQCYREDIWNIGFLLQVDTADHLRGFSQVFHYLLWLKVIDNSWN